MGRIQRVALEHSKYRDQFGIVGISLNLETKALLVNFAYYWDRDHINDIPKQIKKMKAQVNWDILYANQLVGEHLLNAIRKQGISAKVMTTMKNLKDPKDIENIIQMDKFEQVQLTKQLFLNNQIKFPNDAQRQQWQNC